MEAVPAPAGSSGPIDVIVCGDRNIRVGVYATLATLVRATSAPLRVHFLYEGYSPGELDELRAIVPPNQGIVLPVALERRRFAGLSALHGSPMTWARLMAPELVDADRAVYLDGDVIVNLDIRSLFDEPLDEAVIGVSNVGTVERSANEREFLVECGLAAGAPYFNAGVMLVDMRRWREKKLTDECLAFARRHVAKCLSYDQTALNWVLRDRFRELDARYNVPLYPDWRAEDVFGRAAIYHFVGSPKPWDIYGEWVHGSAWVLRRALSGTPLANYRAHRDLSFRKLVRTGRMARSYARVLRRRMLVKPGVVRG
jgi:lipopolysaccharide biosynthesis glycosyltransferase